MSNEDLKYKNKYLKYKNKYLYLQSQIGGGTTLDVENYSSVLQIIKQINTKISLGQLNKELYTQDKDIKNKYHQKYLKYKNKYLYLQSIIGGGPRMVFNPVSRDVSDRLLTDRKLTDRQLTDRRKQTERALNQARREENEKEKAAKAPAEKAAAEKAAKAVAEKAAAEKTAAEKTAAEKAAAEKAAKAAAEKAAKAVAAKAAAEKAAKAAATKAAAAKAAAEKAAAEKAAAAKAAVEKAAAEKAAAEKAAAEKAAAKKAAAEKAAAEKAAKAAVFSLIKQLNPEMELTQVNKVMNAEHKTIINDYHKKLLTIALNGITLPTLFNQTKISVKNLPIILMKLLLNTLNTYSNLDNLEIIEIDSCKLDTDLFIILNKILLNTPNLKKFSFTYYRHYFVPLSLVDYDFINTALSKNLEELTLYIYPEGIEFGKLTKLQDNTKLQNNTTFQSLTILIGFVDDDNVQLLSSYLANKTKFKSLRIEYFENKSSNILDIINNITTLKELYIDNYDYYNELEYSDASITQLLKDKLVLLEKLSISYVKKNLVNILLYVLENTKTLKILEIGSIEYNCNQTISDISKIDNKTLTELNIGNNNVDLEGFKAIADLIKNNETLTKIDLKNVTFEIIEQPYDELEETLLRSTNTDKKMMIIIQALKKNNTLKKLNFSSNYLGTHPELCVKPFVQAGNKLIKISWYQMNVVRRHSKKGTNWFDFESYYTINLYKINVDDRHRLIKTIDTSDLEVTFDNLENDTTYFFNLFNSYNGSSYDSDPIIPTETPIQLLGRKTMLFRLIDELFPRKTLESTKPLQITELNLKDTVRNIKDIEIITTILSDNSRVNMLTHLNLDSNRITDDGLLLITNILNNTNLQFLSISDNFFSIIGVLDLILKLINNNKLSELKLLFNKIHFNESNIINLVKLFQQNQTLLKLHLHGLYFSITDYKGKLITRNNESVGKTIGIIKLNLNLLEKINPYLGTRILIDLPFKAFEILE